MSDSDVIEKMAFRLQSIIGDHVRFATHREAAEAAARVLLEAAIDDQMNAYGSTYAAGILREFARSIGIDLSAPPEGEDK